MQRYSCKTQIVNPQGAKCVGKSFYEVQKRGSFKFGTCAVAALCILLNRAIMGTLVAVQ